MRDAKDTDDVVATRMRALHDADAAGPVGRGGPAGPLRWSDIVPAWAEVDGRSDEAPGSGRSGGDEHGLPDGPGAAGAVPLPAGVESYAWEMAGAPEPLPGAGAFRDEPGPALPGAGAFGDDPGGPRKWLHAFDPGRPGVRALAVVAVVVVLVAAFLAWQSRPRVEPVAPGLGVTPAAGPVGMVGAAPAGAGPVGAGSAGVASASAEVVVAVGGKVRKPGLVRLAPGARVADALTAAGGADPGVDVAGLNLARKVTDGELIMVGASLPPGAVPTAGPVPSGGAGPAAGPAGGLVNLNTATLADLDGLPGVGPVLAQRILDARTAQGGFRAVTDLRKVDGIGDARFEQLKDLVTV
ncbi:helix-hairpin-helix domain-containing protein [Actinoplanes awajinensis]|uniref:helix-hairpin-helix domain-containing protein n=1 Tax=Actinoplanes awajinensis TaxID=135946 RepID=UPI000A41BA59